MSDHDNAQVIYRFSALDAGSENGVWQAVAVPSRLYSVQSNAKPLAGKRITVMDNIMLEGIPSSLSNRAFLETFGPDTKTAEFAQRLINLGATSSRR